ncbi:MAG: hypothetical protein P1S60_09205 [Anaerolineae bacterium]|nr:hypothetical protein [Anaerolineae bacterium]
MHRCIYCDSRSECYQIEVLDGEVLVKENAIELLRKELASKRVKGVIGLGSMNDPYMPLERKINLVGRALEVGAISVAYCARRVRLPQDKHAVLVQSLSINTIVLTKTAKVF